MGRVAAAIFVLLFVPQIAHAACDPDAEQSSGSIYRICMPAPEAYNGMLVVWAHGFQDAGTPVSIPEEQLCFSGICLPDLINGLGFAFATNSYSKTGLAVQAGRDDLLDLVNLFAAQKGQPDKVFLLGASEGGLITTLLLEQRPDVFSAGVAACGPIGDFPLQINYFGDARATFQLYFPGLIPGNPFSPSPALAAIWNDYYEIIVKPIVLAPANRTRLNEWAKVARLPFDADNYLETVEVSVRDVLRYSVINIADAAATLGGFPYDNTKRFFTGSSNDLLLNLLMPRVAASPAALQAMQTYQTSGTLERPLITLHTLRDQQVPYVHEQLYALKTLASGALLTRHLPLAVDRFEHCNFNADEALISFVLMLFYDGAIDGVSGVGSVLSGPALTSFETRARNAGLPATRDGASMALKYRQRH